MLPPNFDISKVPFVDEEQAVLSPEEAAAVGLALFLSLAAEPAPVTTWELNARLEGISQRTLHE